MVQRWLQSLTQLQFELGCEEKGWQDPTASWKPTFKTSSHFYLSLPRNGAFNLPSLVSQSVHVTSHIVYPTDVLSESDSGQVGDQWVYRRLIINQPKKKLPQGKQRCSVAGRQRAGGLFLHLRPLKSAWPQKNCFTCFLMPLWMWLCCFHVEFK